MTLLIASKMSAQTIVVGSSITSSYSVAYIDSNQPTISWSLDTPSAGMPFQNVSNSDLFLRTSVYEGSWGGWGWGHNRGYITAAISSGSVPSGTTLTAVSAPCTTTNSGGSLGSPTGVLTLTTSSQRIVTGIGTSYTGTGDTDGYQITFALTPSDYSQLVAGTYNVSVIFTIHP